MQRDIKQVNSGQRKGVSASELDFQQRWTSTCDKRKQKICNEEDIKVRALLITF